MNLKELLASAERPVALTGAGISAPSGIPTFDMLWKGKPVRDFLSREYFQADRQGFLELFVEMVRWREREPNEAHMALARRGVSIITQNIDGLHRKAGSCRLIELHGNCGELVCRTCGDRVDAGILLASAPCSLEDDSLCRFCGSPYDIDVVLYGDNLHCFDEAVQETLQTDLFLVIGTSLTTYPANQLPWLARQNGVRVVEINEDCVRVLRDV